MTMFSINCTTNVYCIYLQWIKLSYLILPAIKPLYKIIHVSNINIHPSILYERQPYE